MVRSADPRTLRREKPFDGLFPAVASVAASITADMKAHGFDDAFPIVVWGGLIIDGHTRASVATALGCEVAVVDREFGSVREAIDYAVHCQKDRRNMTNAGIIAAIEAIDAEERKAARDRQITLAGTRTETSSSNDDKVESGRSGVRIGKSLGIGSATVDRVRAIERGPEDIKQKVEAGEISITRGAELALRRKKEGKEEADPKFITSIRAAINRAEREVMSGPIGARAIEQLGEFASRLMAMKKQAAIKEAEREE